jgi:RimJ/RimL family protein N-acetyltransferase
MRARGRLCGGYQCPRERLNLGSWSAVAPWVCSCFVEEHAPALHGTLIRLRAHEPADFAALNDLINDPEVGEGLGMVMPQPVSGYQAFIEMAQNDHSKAMFVIERLDGGVPVGACSFFTIEPAPRTAVIGIWLGKPYWGGGIGTDAVRTLCRFGFDHMNLQRIELTVFASNPRARRAYEKVGFVVEGTRRRSEFVRGHHVDSYLMGVLPEELVR